MTHSAGEVSGARTSATRYAVFLATPMSGFGDEAEYAEHRATMLEAIRLLRDAGVAPVYFAGEQIHQTSDFTSEHEAFVHDLDALRASSVFFLIYPRRVVSSALIELGIALALEKPIYVFTPRRDYLPFLVTSAEAVSGQHGMPLIRLIEYTDADDLGAKLRGCAAMLPDRAAPQT